MSKAADSSKRSRRPRLFRRRRWRWLARAALWSLALLALLAWGAKRTLRTEWVREEVRQRVERLATERLATSVSIGGIDFTLLPWTIELRDVRLGGGAGATGPVPPLVEVPWALVEADPWALRAQTLRLDRVVVEKPIVHVAFLADGSDNLFSPPGGGDGGRFDIFVGQLVVDEAEFRMDRERLRLSVRADAAHAALQGRGELRLLGDVAAEQIAVTLPGAPTLEGLAVTATTLLDRTGLRIEDAVVRGPGMQWRAGGGCSWRDDLKCEVHVRGAAETRLLAILGYFDDLRGRVSVEGSVVWRPGSVGWRSRFTAPELILFERTLRDVEGVLVADPQGMQLALERARYADGGLVGSVAFDLRDPDEPVTVDVEARRLRLSQVLADQGLDLPGLGGRLDGPVHYRFTRGSSRRGSGSGALQIVEEPIETPIEAAYAQALVTLTGNVPIRIEDGVIRGDTIAVQSDSQSLLARGDYDLDTGTGSFAYEIATRDVAPLVALLPGAGIEAGIEAGTGAGTGDALPMWQPTTGAGQVGGTLRVSRAGGVESDVRLRLDDVTARSLPRPQRVSGTLRVDESGLSDLRIEVGGETQALLVEGSVPFEVPAESLAGLDAVPRGGLRLVIDAVDWPIDPIRPWVPLAIPITGRVSGRFTLAPGPADTGLEGHLQVAARRARWRDAAGRGRGPVFDAIAVDMTWNDARVRLDDLTFDSAAGTLQGQGSIDRVTEQIDIALTGQALALDQAPLSSYRPRDDLHGRLDVEARVTGTLAEPSLDGLASVTDLMIGPASVSGGTVRGRWDGQTVALDARLLDGWTLRGGGTLDDREAALRFAFDVPNLEAALDLWAVTVPPTLTGAVRGTASIDGSLDDGWPTVATTVESLDLSLAGRRLRNRAPAEIRLGPEGGELVSLRVGEPGADSELRVLGTFGYDLMAPLNLEIDGLVAAPWLRVAGLDGLEAGTLQVTGRIAGTLAVPRPVGRGLLSSGRLTMPGDVPHALNEIEAALRLAEDAVVLETLSASLGGGTIEASGRSAPTEGTGDWSHRYQVSGRAVNLLVPEGWNLLADADLVLRSRDDAGFEIGGRASLARAEYRVDLPVGFAQVLARLLARQRLEVDAASTAWTRTRLNVELASEDGLRVRNNLADLTGSADLVVRGTVAQPVIFGTVDIDRGSALVYNSTEYEIQRGRLTFANPARLDPEVDLVATTRVREFDVNLSLSGTAERLDAGFSSEPPLPDLDVFHLLAGGDPVDAVAASVVRDLSDAGGAAGASAAQFLYGQAASLVGERVGALFGLDTFRIDPLTGSGDALSRARITVGKQLSKDLAVTYSADPSSTEEQRLQVEWRLGRNLVLVLTQNGDETYAADVRLEQAF